MLEKIGIVGIGYVGQAIYNCYTAKGFEVVTVDVDQNKSNGTYQDLMSCKGVFVCVPSPDNGDGTCDTSILDTVLYLLKDYKNVIISKTTAPPDFYERMQTIYPNLVHVPEFLTAVNAYEDFTNQKNAIIGGYILSYQTEAERILKLSQPIKNTIFCRIGEAALIKYMINSFLATKVIFMNEAAALANALGYDWKNLYKMLDLDSRVGQGHAQVPGPDGQYGFGGMCFPKDTAAMIQFAKKTGIEMDVLKTAVKKNLLLRLQKPK